MRIADRGEDRGDHHSHIKKQPEPMSSNGNGLASSIGRPRCHECECSFVTPSQYFRNPCPSIVHVLAPDGALVS